MKRVIDIVLVCIAGFIFFFPGIFIFLAVRVTSPGPALYWSERMGRNLKPFMMPKFRTMKVSTPLEPTENLVNPGRYITPLGGFLRKTSLDELPQLYSVFVGNMSLVGPRPVLPSQVDLLKKREQAGVHRLRPGITGWAQINGRDDIGIDEKVRLDEEYLRKHNILLDLLIMWKTVFYVVRSRGVWH